MKIEKGKLYYDSRINKVVQANIDKDNEGDFIQDKIAVHCFTERDWNYVKSKGYELRRFIGSSIYSLNGFNYYDFKHFDITIDQFKKFYPEQDKFAELKEAHKNGVVIQYKSRVDGEWCTVKNDIDLWHDVYEYRIKPEEEQDEYNWVNNALEAKEDVEILRKAKERAIEQDKINPHHYNSKGIQPIDYIEANNMNFNEGNVIKYVTRYKEKNGLEDLKKAQVYLQRLIDKYEN